MTKLGLNLKLSLRKRYSSGKFWGAVQESIHEACREVCGMTTGRRRTEERETWWWNDDSPFLLTDREVNEGKNFTGIFVILMLHQLEY